MLIHHVLVVLTVFFTLIAEVISSLFSYIIRLQHVGALAGHKIVAVVILSLNLWPQLLSVITHVLSHFAADFTWFSLAFYAKICL